MLVASAQMLAAGAPQTKGFVLLLPLFVVAILIVVITGSLRRGLPKRAGRSQPRRRHIAVRIICGVFGAGLLIAVGVGTWLDVRGVYGSASPAHQVMLSLPAKPPGPLPQPGGKKREVTLPKARMLIHFVFLERGQPVHAEELDVRWPRDRGRSFQLSGTWRNVEYEISFHPSPLVVSNWNGKPEVGGLSQYTFRARGFSWSSSRSGVFKYEQPQIVKEFRSGGNRAFLSTAPRVSCDCRVVAFSHRVQGEDPLRKVSLRDYFGHVRLPARDVNGRTVYGPEPGRLKRRSLALAEAPPFFRLAAHLGVAGLFLLLAAILLAQLFARRGLGFAATVLGCVLFAAVLDRSALAAHSSRLADPQGPLPARCLAAESLTGTFLYRQSAWRAASEAADDDSAPPALRAVAKDVAGWLLPIRDAEFAPPKLSLSWDLKHAENAGFFLEKRHSGDNEHFVLHVPAGKASLGIVPDVKIRMLGRAGGGDEWSAYMPLSWDKSRLVKEYGSDEPSISHNLFSGTMTWTHELKRLAPNILRLVFHLTYTPHAPGADAVKKDVSVTVEVREGSSAR